MSREFVITYDYLCPFARNANEAVVEALQTGADWRVTFRPFSLTQNHTGPDDDDVWDGALDAELGSGVEALLWSLAIRDDFPDGFLDFHKAMFVARHDEGLDIGDRQVIEGVVSSSGLDVDAVTSVVRSGLPQKKLKEEHLGLVEELGVFGVPTFIAGGEAVFVRVMERHNIRDIERVIDLIGWTNVNEFKRTRIPK